MSAEPPASEKPAPPADRWSEKAWFDDGNIVLRAQGKVFRVYKGILARESRVFRDMFLFPTSGQEDTYEDTGCPVVEVQDDPEDMELFLSVMFDSGCVRYTHTLDVSLLNLVFIFSRALYDQCSLREHIHLLDICSKYQATRLFRRVCDTLTHFYPCTLSGVDHALDCDAGACPAFIAGHPLHSGEESAERDAALLMSVAERTGMQIFLPVAFAWACLDDVDDILLNTEDGWPWPAVGALIRGQRRLDRLARTKVFAPIFATRRASPDISDACEDPPRCHKTRHHLVEQLELDQYGTAWPFYRLDTTIGLPARLCAPCKKVVEEAYQRERAEVWERLPEIFSLPSWDELRKARDSALEEG